MSDTAGSAKVLEAVIVGCGAIAGGFDEGRAGPDILTHAKAYREHPGFRIAGCVEPNEARRRHFMEAWDIETGAGSLDELIGSGIAVDAVSLCTPTAHHGALLERLLDVPIRGVMCEKPLTDDLAGAHRLVAAYAAAGCPLAVNYLRRWDDALETLKQEIAEGRWGTLQTAECQYGKGVRHNGGHMIDTLQFLLGPLTPKNVFRVQIDSDDTDPTLDARLETATGAPVMLNGTDSRLYDVFEARLTFEHGQVALEQGMSMIRERPVGDNPRFAGHKTLEPGTVRESGQGRALYRAIDNLYKAITDGAPLASDGRTALATQDVCERLIELAKPARHQS
ncbi:MAG: Gfo/Idh/MocA family oxidoreductase [Rhodospirillales bacterium]